MTEKPPAPSPAPVPQPAAEAQSAPPGPELLTIDDFLKIDLRVALVTAAERVEGADKLLKLQLDLGGSTRQIVAGIAQHYQPEELPGRLVVVVANLAPAKIRGVESNGMLLAASAGGKLRLVSVPEEIGSGADVK